MRLTLKISQILIDQQLFFSISECTENVNQSFGNLDISYSNNFDPYCNWIVGNAGIPQAVAIVSIHQMNFGAKVRYITCFFGCSYTIILWP